LNEVCSDEEPPRETGIGVPGETENRIDDPEYDGAIENFRARSRELGYA
jgi:hypothetical protein